MTGDYLPARHLSSINTGIPEAGLDLQSFELVASEGKPTQTQFFASYQPSHSETSRILRLRQRQLPLTLCPSVKTSNEFHSSREHYVLSQLLFRTDSKGVFSLSDEYHLFICQRCLLSSIIKA